MDEIWLKFFSIVLVALIGVANLMKHDPLKRWKDDIKDDLEILLKLPEDHPHRKLVESSLSISVLGAYLKDHKPWYSWAYKQNRPIIVMTVLLVFTVSSLVFV